MNNKIYFNVLIVCITTHIVRTIYEILKHRKIIIPDMASFIIIFINMVLLWLSWIYLCSIDILKINIPAAIEYLGLFIAAAGVVIFLTALFTIKTLETYTGALITTGIYSKIRHPMYFAFLLWLIGFPVYYGAVISFVIGLFFILNVLYWRRLEEIELIDRFPDYHNYKLRTIF